MPIKCEIICAPIKLPANYMTISYNKHQHLTDVFAKLQTIMKHNMWDSLPKSYNYNPTYLLTVSLPPLV